MAKAREVVFKFLKPLPVVVASQIKSIDCLSLSTRGMHQQLPTHRVGREGEGVGGDLSKLKKLYCHFAIDGVGMFEACMCTFRMGVERIGSTLQCPSHSCRNPPESTGIHRNETGICRNPQESSGMGCWKIICTWNICIKHSISHLTQSIFIWLKPYAQYSEYFRKFTFIECLNR